MSLEVRDYSIFIFVTNKRSICGGGLVHGHGDDFWGPVKDTV